MYKIQLGELPSLDKLAVMWRELESRSNASFFVSWLWIGTWLESLDGAVKAQLLCARDEANNVVGLGIVVRRRQWRLGCLPVSTAHLNETGRRCFDALTIEYNDFLIQATNQEPIRASMHERLWQLMPSLDEFHISGGVTCPPSAPADLRLTSEGHTSFHIDLGAIRAVNGNYLATLKQRQRYLVRKSLKRLTEMAPLRVEQAATLEQARAWLAELMELHSRYWQAKGEPGAFGSEFQRRFHTRLLDEGFASGAVKLLAVKHGERVLGYFHYFCRDGWVHYYQSGIDYVRYEASDSPGLAAHALAAEHFMQAGTQIYDFMTGTFQYKRTLATSTSELQWIKLARDTVKMRVVNHLWEGARSARDRWHALRRGPVAAAPQPTTMDTAHSPIPPQSTLQARL